MNILVTNDDGWEADGIKALFEVAESFGDCVLVGPKDHQSGISHQLTLNRPIELAQKSANVFTVDSTPADCVRIGLTHLAQELDLSFDLVLSGINNGGNLGSDIYLSGTVAAVREAALSGVKAIALSQHRLRFKEAFDWTHSKSIAKKVLAHCLDKADLHAREWLNVNLPDLADHEQLPSFNIVNTCTLDPSPIPFKYEAVKKPSLERDQSDSTLLSYNGKYRERPRAAGSDIETCFHGNVSITRHSV